jgi:hypothetical protein
MPVQGRQLISTPDHVGVALRFGKPQSQTGNDNARHLLRRSQDPDPAGNVRAGTSPINK